MLHLTLSLVLRRCSGFSKPLSGCELPTQQKERKVNRVRRSSPPPSLSDGEPTRLWSKLPTANRGRLLGLLTRLLERQFDEGTTTTLAKEGNNGHESE